MPALRASSKGKLALALGLALALFARARPAFAQDRLNECVTAHADGQALKNQGKLREARARFAACLAEDCPAIVREDCVAFDRAVAASLASVILRALDQNGNATSEPVVSIDDAATSTPLDGRPVLLEPGRHHLRFRHPDGSIRDLEVTLSQGEQGREVVADFRRAPVEVPADDGSQAAQTAILVSGGVAVAALGAFTFFAISGNSIHSDLEDCKPNCQNPDDYDRMKARYLAADISLGVALVSAGVGAYVWLEHPKAFSAGSTPPRRRLGFRLSPSGVGRGVGLWALGDF